MTTRLLNKVPQLTVFFWIIKILATTVGETLADYLATTLQLGLTATTGIMGAVLIIALIVQFKLSKYIPAVYWLVVVLLSIVGTLISDNLVDNMGVSLATTSTVFAVLLSAVFIAWYKVEGNLSVHDVTTTRKELFYWATILFTFSLGTSAGDLVSEALGLGYGIATLLFAGVIALVALTHYYAKLNAIVAFWIAYILTRPLGASLGDLLSQTTDDGGLGLGTTITSIAFLSTIIGLVIYVTEHNRKYNDAI
jgi:uncharacterized membrane-anchored protein